MGVGANSNRNKSLNDRAERAAGRQKDRGPMREAIRDAQGAEGAAAPKGPAGGAFGKDGRANRRRSGNPGGEGGGGGGAATGSDLADVKPAGRRARSRK